MAEACKSALDVRDVKIWDIKVGGKYFIENRDETRTVSFPHPNDSCSVCGDDSGLKMQCGHYLCPDDVLDWAWDEIKRSKHQINCPTCVAIISMEDIITFGIPNSDEKQFLDTAILVNYCESQDIQKCPGCDTYCERIQTDSPQVICTICTRKKKNNIFCWSCLKPWNNPGNYQDCKNPGCKSVIFEKLQNCGEVTYGHGFGFLYFEDFATEHGIKFPKMRACPNCFTVVEHIEGCNEMICKVCHHKFCFRCLTKTKVGSLICRGQCAIAPIQTRLRN